MPRDFPDRVDPWKASDGRLQYAGTLPLAGMKRLLELLDQGALDGSEQVAFDARFDRDEENRPLIRFHVRASLPLVCQRSLETFSLDVERDTALTVIDDLSELALVSSEADTTVADNGYVWFRDLAEDELLVGMPEYPVSPNQQPVTYMTGEDPNTTDAKGASATQAENPFAALKDMLEDSTD